jgi:hypothetical protein
MQRRDFMKIAVVGAAASMDAGPATSKAKVQHPDQSDIDAYDHIHAVVELAMQGAAEGDVAKLRQAFHKDAWMFGEVDGKRYDEPISSFFDLCEKHPLGRGGHYRSRIVSTTHVGPGAMAMVVEDGCWGTASFVDFFTVTRLGEGWKITNKTFAYTGGEIPSEVTK